MVLPSRQSLIGLQGRVPKHGVEVVGPPGQAKPLIGDKPLPPVAVDKQ